MRGSGHRPPPPHHPLHCTVAGTRPAHSAHRGGEPRRSGRPATLSPQAAPRPGSRHHHTPPPPPALPAPLINVADTFRPPSTPPTPPLALPDGPRPSSSPLPRGITAWRATLSRILFLPKTNSGGMDGSRRPALVNAGSRVRKQEKRNRAVEGWPDSGVTPALLPVSSFHVSRYWFSKVCNEVSGRDELPASHHPLARHTRGGGGGADAPATHQAL